MCASIYARQSCANWCVGTDDAADHVSVTRKIVSTSNSRFEIRYDFASWGSPDI